MSCTRYNTAGKYYIHHYTRGTFCILILEEVECDDYEEGLSIHVLKGPVISG